jgi:hypothetical protein
MLNDLLLLSGNDIPFAEAQITIHQPTIKEIAYIGEENFYTGCEFLRFSKDNLEDEDKIHLESYTNFDVLMSIINEKNITIQQHKTCVFMVLSLLFPGYKINIESKCFSFERDGEDKHEINNQNYDSFLKILNTMFCLKTNKDDTYNPSGDIAKKIADKLKKRHQRLAETEKPSKVAIISRYVSILAVGQQKDINSFMQYTVYQLFDEFKRYELKLNWDIYLQAKMAGAKDLKEVDDWMADIHLEE